MDFALVLVLATLVTGVIWAVDAIAFAPRRRARAVEAAAAAGDGEAGEAAPVQPPREPVLVEYARSFFPIILVVLLVRSFVVEPFRIPSGSMMPTLLIGDFILVNKFDYGLRLPVLNKKVLSIGEPHRGDVIVFRYPENPSVDFIKRVVGVPGDHLVYKDKVLYINGKEMPQKFLQTYIGDGSGAVMNGAREYREKLGTVKHDILRLPNRMEGNFTFDVPPGQYFVMGDNRDDSRDSRYWGTVPEKNLVGKAFLIWMNWDTQGHVFDWKRIGTIIH